MLGSIVESGGVTWPPHASWNPASSILMSPASLGPNIGIPLIATPSAAPCVFSAFTASASYISPGRSGRVGLPAEEEG